MDWIDENVSVGSLEDALSVNELKAAGIDLIIDARTLFDGFSGINIRPLVAKVLRAGDMLVALTRFNAKIFVHCLLGIDRTPFIAMVYVSKRYGMPYEDAYRLVDARHPSTVFHWDWVRMLEEVE